MIKVWLSVWLLKMLAAFIYIIVSSVDAKSYGVATETLIAMICVYLIGVALDVYLWIVVLSFHNEIVEDQQFYQPKI